MQEIDLHEANFHFVDLIDIALARDSAPPFSMITVSH